MQEMDMHMIQYHRQLIFYFSQPPPEQRLFSDYGYPYLSIFHNGPMHRSLAKILIMGKSNK